MPLGDAIPLALAISSLVVYLTVIWRYVTRPDREPVPYTQFFQDTWHVPGAKHVNYGPFKSRAL